MAEDSGYELTPPEGRGPGGEKGGAVRKPRPGDVDFVPPVPIIIKEDEEEVTEAVVVDPDVEKTKLLAILGYGCFLIPLLLAPKSRFARFHANQGLLTQILWVVAVGGVLALWLLNRGMAVLLAERIAILYYFFACIFHVLQPVLLVAALGATIFGIVQAANGLRQVVPLIGHFVLIEEEEAATVVANVAEAEVKGEEKVVTKVEADVKQEEEGTDGHA